MIQSASIKNSLQQFFLKQLRNDIELYDEDDDEKIARCVQQIIDELEKTDLTISSHNSSQLFSQKSVKVACETNTNACVVDDKLYITAPLEDLYVDTCFLIKNNQLAFNCIDPWENMDFKGTVKVEIYNERPDAKERTVRNSYREAERVISQTFKQPPSIKRAIKEQSSCCSIS